MQVKDLQPRQGKVELTGTISTKENPREVNKPNFSGKVCNAILQDETGEIKITLWNEQADLVNEGDTIKITNGYVGEWQGEMQLSTGKFGKLEVVTKGQPSSTSESSKQKKDVSGATDEPAKDNTPSYDEEDVF